MEQLGDIKLDGKWFRIDRPTYRVKDTIDFAPRAATPGGSVVMSDLGMFQPQMQTDWRHGFGFHWYSDAMGYMRTTGNVDTRHPDLAMLFTKATSSDTDNNAKHGMTTFNNIVWTWGAGGLRKYSGGSWSAHTFSGIEQGGSRTQSGASGSDELSFKHTVTTLGQNRILIVDIGTRSNVTVSSVTFQDQALTEKYSVGSGPKAFVWYLLDPPEGEGDVVIVLSAASSVAAQARTLLYVDQTTPFSNSNTTSGTGTSSTIDVTSDTDETVFDVLCKVEDDGDAILTGADQTREWLIELTTATKDMTAVGSWQAGAATVTMSWQWTNSRNYAQIGYSIAPATQAVTGTVNFAYSAGDYLFYCPDGQRLRKISTAGVDSAAGLDANAIDFKWMIIHNGYIFAGVDGTNRVHYSGYADLRDLEGTDADPSAVYVGIGNVPTIGAKVYAGNLYVSRNDGLWHLGDDLIARKVIDLSGQISSNNFRSMEVVAGMLVFTVRDGVWQWNAARHTPFTPPKITDTFPYVTYGSFDHMIENNGWLYLIGHTNQTTYEEHLLCWDGVGWHKMADLITNGTDAVTMLGYDSINNRIWYHVQATADATYYIPIQNNSDFPYADFPTTGTHSLIFSRWDSGFRRVTKSLNSIIIEASNVTAARYLSVYYSLDGGSWKLWDTITSAGVSTLYKPSHLRSEEFNYIQFRIDFVTDSATQSPILEGITMRFIMRPKVAWGYSFSILGTGGAAGKILDTRTGKQIITSLRGIRDSKKPIEFVDIMGNTVYGYLTSVTESLRETKAASSDGRTAHEYLITVNFVEVQDENAA